MNEKPILFSSSMVRAILDGRKSMTRRVAKVPDGFEPKLGTDGLWYIVGNLGWDGALSLPCPYGRVGDRLWVRENWSPDHAAFYPNFPVVYQAEGYDPREVSSRGKVLPFAISPEESTNRKFPFRWRPSIHMPRRVCRIVLEIADVRVERLQTITEEDAIAEGVTSELEQLLYDDGSPSRDYEEISARDSFQRLWDSLNAKRGFGWDVNPWVWVISFERMG